MKRLSLGLPGLLALLSCAATSASPVAPAPTHEVRTDIAPPEVTRPVEAPAPRLSRKAQVQRILPHNVRLALLEGEKVRSTASGVVIGNEQTPQGPISYVLTNAHAVDTRELKHPGLVVIVDERADSTEYRAEVVALGAVPDMDLALVKVPGLPRTPARLATDAELEMGEDVVVAASPFGRALSLSGGMVSQIEWDKESKRPRMVKTDAPIGYGASGGGIFSLESGKLLAIVEGYRTAKVGFSVAEQDFSFDVPMPGETFAAPGAKVRQFLSQRGFSRLLGEGVGEAGGPSGAQTASR
ncbi:serine protease [Cystobacter fuscus]|uniref:S1 family peptidase n=1 Tax=Cystobacter fuscus TaxID=43 RepID=UPI002B2C6269|nr:trypsin-like peptidase domain-containing protein [Cystobacter fuscus]